MDLVAFELTLSGESEVGSRMHTMLQLCGPHGPILDNCQKHLLPL